MLQCCLNGSRSRRDHPAVPLTPEALARDAAAVRAQGADCLHLHPRDAQGRETLAAADIAAALTAIRKAAPGMPVGISTGAWIPPTGPARLARMREWTVLPDYVSVNVREADAADVVGLMQARGVGIEAGVWDRADAERIVATRLPRYSLRVLVEIHLRDPAAAEAEAEMVLGMLARADVTRPILLHGQEGSVWPMVRMAAARGLSTRVGLEDGLDLPGQVRATGNAALVAAAARILAG